MEASKPLEPNIAAKLGEFKAKIRAVLMSQHSILPISTMSKVF
jgi:hypothetical protein